MSTQTQQTPSLSDRFRAALLGGAIGDYFGAPVENLKTMRDITSAFGRNGLQEPARYDGSWLGADAPSGIGLTRDDTAMTVATLLPMLEARRSGTDTRMIYDIWQAYLLWGAQQKHGGTVAALLDDGYMPPAGLTPFLYRTGAGRGTIAALMEGRPGTPEAPLVYKRVLDGKHVKSPNAGCGGMMRVLPAAALYDDIEQVFDAACRIAAITHGHPDAMYGSGAVAVLLHQTLAGKGVRHALNVADKTLAAQNTSDVNPLRQAFHRACAMAVRNPMDMGTINDLPRELGFAWEDAAFTSAPVWAQVVYTLASLEVARLSPSGDSFKAAMRLAANHTGDSDSVASIAGQVLGAAWGPACLPPDWLDMLQRRAALESIAATTARHLQPIRPNTPPALAA